MTKTKEVLTVEQALERAKVDPEFKKDLKKSLLSIPARMKEAMDQFKKNISTTANVNNTENEDTSKEA